MIVKNQFENDKVTWMLVVISITFGILNFPYFILWLVSCIITVRGKTPSAYIESGRMVAEVLYLLNYSLYFFLYVISRRSFRKVLIEKMRWRCDWFEQWRLNEMRLDAALRAQQMPKQTMIRNESRHASVENQTLLTSIRPSSARHLVPLETINDEQLIKTTTNISSRLITSEQTNGMYLYEYGNTV